MGSIPTPGSIVLEGRTFLVINEVGGPTKEKAVEETFVALFALTDLRQIFRDTKPAFKLNIEQKEQIKQIIERVRQSLNTIESELIE